MTISSAPRFTLTDDEHDLLPSADDVEFYAKHGWYLSKKLFTDDEVDELIGASDRYYGGERDRSLPVRPPANFNTPVMRRSTPSCIVAVAQTLSGSASIAQRMA